MLTAEKTSPTNDIPFYLQGLNERQQDAVLHLDSPLLVLAGAGTGKTKVLTSRIAHMITTSAAAPWQILAVTFTNKAAQEIKHRVENLLQSPQNLPWAGTFHSICAKILRIHAPVLGFSRDFNILNDDDQEKLLKHILESAGEDLKRNPVKSLLYAIDSWKNLGYLPHQVPIAIIPKNLYGGKAVEYYQIYQESLKSNNCMDFGDLILQVIYLFQTYPDILAEYQHKFKYILVDEYQDTNIAQYLWLRLLAQKSGRICCVGDDDQSIYSWRGAQVENILRFEQEFPNSVAVRLEQNYRSTPTILRAASGVIAHNQRRLGKELFSNLEDGNRILVKIFWNGEEEAKFIADHMHQQSLSLQTDLGANDTIAILVRTSAQMRLIEEKLILTGIPYCVIGGLKFYERKEIRDILAYLRILSQPHDNLAFERILNTPKRGLGDAIVKKLYESATTFGESLFMTAHRLVKQDKALRPQALKSLQGFLNDLASWKEKLATISLSELTSLILEDSGYLDFLRHSKESDSGVRIENLKEFTKAIDEYQNLTEFLEHISLFTDNITVSVKAPVTLMTLHAAKGLEFETVYLPGWEEGLFPSQKSIDEHGMQGLEEERRLAYVALTRAKKQIILSYAQNRRLYNQWQNTTPSRFISELPDDTIEYDGYQAPSHYRPDSYMQSRQMQKINRLDSDLEVGQKVFHQKLGMGIILTIEDDKALVDFTHAGQRQVIVHYLVAAT